MATRVMALSVPAGGLMRLASVPSLTMRSIKIAASKRHNRWSGYCISYGSCDVRWRDMDQARCTHSASTYGPPPSRSIAVVGAGVSGLTAALHLKRGLPQHRIKLYEKSDRLGGWAHSERVAVEGVAAGRGSLAGTALLESGPRSLRPAGLPGLAMLDLISSLGLYNDLIKIPKSHPSAKNRYLYLNDKIHALPSSLGAAVRMLADRGHPATKAQLPSTFLRSLQSQKIQESTDPWEDESIESFLKGTLGKPGSSSLPLLEYVGSAVLHGIYAADASQLSVRMVMPQLWALPRTYGGLGRAMLPTRINSSYRSLEGIAETASGEWARIALRKIQRQENEMRQISENLGEKIVSEMKNISIFSFQNGIQVITDAMVEECKRLGVEIETNSCLDQVVARRGQPPFLAKTATSGSQATSRDKFDRVVAALPSITLARLIDSSLPSLTANGASTVSVVNVVLPRSANVRVPAGFGFLVPRAVAQQGDNPMGLLGVVFDSEAVPGQDDCIKLTMMFGGPYWRQGFGAFDMLEVQSDEGAFLGSALSLLSRRLSIDERLLKGKDAQALVRLQIQRNCIPTYSPGHLARMCELHQVLKADSPSESSVGLSVIGASYTGISMNDCVLYARRTAQRIIEAELSAHQSSAVTGLEELIEG